MNFGVPYMGSKSKICEQICSRLPSAENFYDLFGGGFSITHFMIKHRGKDFKQFHFNEIRPGMTKLIQDAIDGKYNYNVFKPDWISREDFFAKKENDLYVKIIWSFGNNGSSYLFGKDIEQQKRSLHMAIVFNEFDNYAKEIFGCDSFKAGFGINEKRLYLKNRLRLLQKDRCDLERLQQLEQLQQLQQLERLQQRIAFYNTSYENVEIKPNSTIYCDIPYIGTTGYDGEFNHKKFYDWADSQKEPVYISEYRLDDPRFKCIANFQKRSMLSAKKGNLIKTEKIFTNKAGYARIFDTTTK